VVQRRAEKFGTTRINEHIFFKPPVPMPSNSPPRGPINFGGNVEDWERNVKISLDRIQSLEFSYYGGS